MKRIDRKQRDWHQQIENIMVFFLHVWVNSVQSRSNWWYLTITEISWQTIFHFSTRSMFAHIINWQLFIFHYCQHNSIIVITNFALNKIVRLFCSLSRRHSTVQPNGLLSIGECINKWIKTHIIRCWTFFPRIYQCKYERLFTLTVAPINCDHFSNSIE